MADPTRLQHWRVLRVQSRSLGRKWVGVIDTPSITTSPIASIDGARVTTRSGTVHELDGDVSGIGDRPFHLADGTPYPPGATVDAVPPERGAPAEEIHAHYGASVYVGLLPGGDYETYPLLDPAWARKRADAVGATLYLDGVEVPRG